MLDTNVAGVDLTAVKRFLDLMAEGEAVTFQTFGDQDKSPRLARIIHGTIDERADELAELNRDGAGVFIMVNFGDGKGRSATNVTGVRSLFVDLDGAPLAPVYEAGLSPHVIVESSFGRFHAYWNVADCPKEKFGALQKALAQRFNGDPVVHDLPRVMRVPGFYHLKAEPFQTRIIECNSVQPYPLAEIVEKLKLRDAYSSTQRKNRSKVNENSLIFPEGRRNAGLLGLAGAMRRKGMAGESIEIALLAENRIRCSPPLPENEVRQIALNGAKYVPAPTADHAQPRTNHDFWPLPILPGAFSPPSIEAKILPGWIGDMAEATAKWSQTPPAMAVLMALSVLAAVLQRRFEVAPWGDSYREPLALWTLTALPSGSRKTAVINELTAPLVDWEKRERDRLRPEIGRRHAATEIAKKRIEKLKLDAAKADSVEQRQRIQTEIEKEQSEMPAELFAPRLFTSDVTGERLQQLLFEQDERMAVITDEAGIFQIMGGQYSGGSASLDVFLQGHAGTSLRVDRAGRLAHIDRPALSFGMALQPGILQDVAKSRRFRDSGLLARYLYAIPSSNVGRRDVRARWSIPGSVKDAWYQNINTLLSGVPRPIGVPRTLPFALDAREVWLQLCEYVERNQGPGSKWEHMSDWTAKLPGATARIAALLEIAINGVSVSNVSVDSVERAVKLAYLLAEHAEAAFRLMGAADVESDALVLLGWIKRIAFVNSRAAKPKRGWSPAFERCRDCWPLWVSCKTGLC